MFNRLHHVCVVVRDLDRSQAYYESLGIGPWHDYEKSSPYVRLDVPDPLASADTRYRYVDLDNVQLQLCQPSTRQSPQRRFLDQFGEGVYHLGFQAPDVSAAEQAGRAAGLGVIASGLRADGSGFCYFDTRERAGVTLEVRTTAAER